MINSPSRCLPPAHRIAKAIKKIILIAGIFTSTESKSIDK